MDTGSKKEAGAVKLLKRKWARVSLGMHYGGWALVFLFGVFFNEWLGKELHLLATGIGWFGGGLMVLGVLFWRLAARCPHCGKRGGYQSWVYRKAYCSRCGHVLPFDDGPLHEEEIPLKNRQRFRLKRGWARLTLALTAAGGALLAGAYLVLILLTPHPQSEEEFWAEIETIWAIRDASVYMALAGIALWIAAGFLAWRLKCPGCGQGMAVPWQRRGAARWCHGCGAALAFEDELKYKEN